MTRLGQESYTYAGITKPVTILRGYDSPLVDLIKSKPTPARILLADPIHVGRMYSVAAVIRDLYGMCPITERFNCLIATPWPRSQMQTWCDLLEGFGLPAVELLEGSDEATDRLDAGGIWISPPDILLTYRTALRNTHWSLVILDDAEGWLYDSRFRDAYENLWVGASNISVAVALSPVVHQGEWLALDPSTVIIRRDHERLSLDGFKDFPKPMSRESELEPVVDILKDYFEISVETSGRAMASKMAEFIKDTGAPSWINDDDSEPKWSQLAKALMAIGNIFSHGESGNFGEGLKSARIRLPSESVLADLFNVHRDTVRRAFAQLNEMEILEQTPGGSHLRVNSEVSTTTIGGPTMPNATSVRDVALGWLVARGLSGDGENMIDALESARKSLQELTRTTKEEDRTEPSILDTFKSDLTSYGLESNIPQYQEAIRIAFLSEGQGVEVPKNISTKDISVFQQMDIGWPRLSNYGNQIGRHLMTSLMHSKHDSLHQVFASIPPGIIKLFLDESKERGNVYEIRVPDEKETWEDNFDLGSDLQLGQMFFYKEVNKWTLKLGDCLVTLGLGIKEWGPARRGAKWKAVFFNILDEVIESMKVFLNNSESDLKEPNRLLGQYSLLMTSPVPLLLEFQLAGIAKETLLTYLEPALNQEMVTRVVEQGPAYLLLDQEGYKRTVTRPILKQIIDSMTTFPE